MRKSQPIRVLHVVTSMNRAGLETMLMNYYRHIDRSKVQFDFLVHRPEKADYDDEIVRLGGRIYHFDPISLKTMPGYAKKMANFLEEHPEYKIVHSHLDALSALPLAGAKAAGVPIRIAHSHNNGFSLDVKYPLRQILKSVIPYYATDLFACSSSAGDFMFGRKVQYRLIKNAVDVKQFAYNGRTRHKMRGQLQLGDSFVVGHVGRFSYQKNHEFLVDIFKAVHDKNSRSVLILVGSGEGEDAIKKKVHELGLDESVKFLGLRTDIPDLMQAMDVFVMPSRYEGLPVVSVEAQASGLPCIFSTAVTSELDVTGNCSFISLSTSPIEWADIILRESHKHLARGAALDDSFGYNIKHEARVLQGLYVEINGEQ